MKVRSLIALAAVAGAAASANAFEIRVRFVEQTGSAMSAFVVLPGNTIDASNGAARRIRVQFGVFDDADSAAPAGGYVGWNIGSLAVSGASGNSDETRTPGRLNPFTFAPGGNGNPAADPFDMITGIDNTLGTQSPNWPLNAPQPNPIIRGFNTYMSTYEFTINPIDVGGSNYTVTLGGNVIAATEWRLVGTPIPPEDADEDGMVDQGTGAVTYAPFPTSPRAIAGVLNVIVPGPGSAALLGLGGLLVARRRRA